MTAKSIARVICLVLLALIAGDCRGKPTATPGRAADLLAERHQVQCRHPGEVDKEMPVGQHEPVGTGDEINTDSSPWPLAPTVASTWAWAIACTPTIPSARQPPTRILDPASG